MGSRFTKVPGHSTVPAGDRSIESSCPAMPAGKKWHKFMKVLLASTSITTRIWIDENLWVQALICSWKGRRGGGCLLVVKVVHCRITMSPVTSIHGSATQSRWETSRRDGQHEYDPVRSCVRALSCMHCVSRESQILLASLKVQSFKNHLSQPSSHPTWTFNLLNMYHSHAISIDDVHSRVGWGKYHPKPIVTMCGVRNILWGLISSTRYTLLQALFVTPVFIKKETTDNSNILQHTHCCIICWVWVSRGYGLPP